MTDYLIFFLLLFVGTQFGVALASSIIVHPILAKISRPAAIEVFKPFFHKDKLEMVPTSLFLHNFDN